MHAYTHTYIHTHMHTYIHTCVGAYDLTYEASCMLLATLAMGHPRNTAAIARAGALPRLVELLRHTKPRTRQSACRAVAVLADSAETKAALVGAIPSLVVLLASGNAATQQSAARACCTLAAGSTKNQLALVGEQATAALAALLGVHDAETQEWAQAALFHLALHTDCRPAVHADCRPADGTGYRVPAVVREAVVRDLVGVLAGRSTSAQLKAVECLAMILERSQASRVTIARAGAVPYLVRLLGSGGRADVDTPPERAAAVLAELARLTESKLEIGHAGGLEPLVSMLGSSCWQAQTHAANALRHLSMVSGHKQRMVDLGAVPKLVGLLSSLAPGCLRTAAARHAASSLFGLSTLSDAKARIYIHIDIHACTNAYMHTIHMLTRPL